MRYNSKTYGKRTAKLGEYLIVCDHCGIYGYASEMVKQDKNTGYGGLIVHNFCADGIYWGMFPITPREEKQPIDQRRQKPTGSTMDDVYDPGFVYPTTVSSTVDV